MNYRSCMKLIGSKSGKNSKIWANFGRCTGTCTGVYRYTPPEANMYRYMFNMYRYMPIECNMYRYMFRVYRYMCAQNAQNAMFLYH